MTIAQACAYAESRIKSSNIEFDSEDTKINILHLGQLGKWEVFSLTITPVTEKTNVTAIKTIIKILDKIGFNGLDWRNFSFDAPERYMYFMCAERKMFDC